MNRKVVERRVVTQEWYETETTKTGWDSHGWIFEDGTPIDNTWTVIEHMHVDKFGNPFVGVAERYMNISLTI